MKLDTPFVNGRPGRDWLEGFLSRHPDIAPRKTEHLSSARASAEDPEVLQHWFELLDNVLTTAGVKDMPCQIFNADESGFITDPKSQVVLATKGSKRVNQTIGGSGKEQITVNCSGSASGKVLPPYVIYKGKNLYEAWSKGGPDGACYTTSEKGWMEGPQFLDWFTKLFLTNTSDVSDKPRVLIFDGHLSHLSHSLVKKAKENNVILLRLPAHLTHLLQPFDRAVFRPVKLKWQQLLLKCARTHRGPVGKKDFPGQLKKLFEESFKPETIKAGFSSTGVCPFNPQAITLTERPQVNTPSLSAAPSFGPSPTAPSPGPSSPGPSSAFPAGPSTPAPSPSTVQSTGLLSSVHGVSSTPSSIRNFFLEQLKPHFTNTGRGRSARVQRFRYGESLTQEDCLQRLREEEAAKRLQGRGRGKGKGRGKSTHKGKKCPRSQSPIDLDSSSDDTECGRCGQAGGDNWIQCDICNLWYHARCTDITGSLKEMEQEEWMCHFCTQ